MLFIHISTLAVHSVCHCIHAAADRMELFGCKVSGINAAHSISNDSSEGMLVTSHDLSAECLTGTRKLQAGTVKVTHLNCNVYITLACQHTAVEASLKVVPANGLRSASSA